MTHADPVRAAFEEAQATLSAFLSEPACLDGVRQFVERAAATLERGGLLMACGNGGSMCDAMHFAEEWTGRFRARPCRAPGARVQRREPAHLHRQRLRLRGSLRALGRGLRQAG